MRPNELKFIGPLVDMINNPKNGFAQEEHLFITPHKDVFNVLSQYQNVVLDDSSRNLVNKYAPHCQWLISHDLPGIKETLCIRRKFLKKIVWRTWGGSHQKYNYDDYSFFKALQHRIEDNLYRIYLNYTFGKGVIGVANSVDVIDLRTWLKRTPLFPITYIGSNQYPTLVDVLQEPNKEMGVLKVMVGHQGTVAENHLQILKTLKRFDPSKINIIVPLSYGTKTYIDKLIPQIKGLEMPNVTILNDFLSFREYAELLHTVDVAILDEPSSMALGNISILLFFEKKLVLNKKGILSKVLLQNNIPHIFTDELAKVTFEEFSDKIEYDGRNNDLVLHEYEYYVKQWHDFLDEIEKM